MTLGVIALAAAGAAQIGALAKPIRAPAPVVVPPSRARVHTSVVRGINYLISQQQLGGAISDKKTNETALTSLSIMAMLAVGHQPADSTREGDAIRRALAYVLRPDRQDATGYFGKADNSRMYGQGIATLMLSEVLGMGVSDEQDAIIRDRCQKGLDLILRAQQHAKREVMYLGGWRYFPGSNDADLSVTVWQLMALRSARSAGFYVPAQAIDDAVAYIKRSYNGRRAKGRPTFGYQPGKDDTPTSMTGAGILSLSLCGEQGSEEARAATRWLEGYNLKPSGKWYFYGAYYYAQAMNQRGGPIAAAAQDRVEDALLSQQAADGSWLRQGKDEEHTAGRVYCTSMSLLSLGVRYHFLPVYQR
jgi:hypothetical protein